MNVPLEKPGIPEELVLVHFGVKGMRWGVRKAVDTAIGTKTAGRKPSSYKRSSKNSGWNKLAKRSISSAQGPMSSRKKKLLRAADITRKAAGAALVVSVLASMADQRSGNVFVREISRTAKNTSGRRFVNMSPAMNRTLNDIRSLPVYRG